MSSGFSALLFHLYATWSAPEIQAETMRSWWIWNQDPGEGFISVTYQSRYITACSFVFQGVLIFFWKIAPMTTSGKWFSEKFRDFTIVAQPAQKSASLRKKMLVAALFSWQPTQSIHCLCCCEICDSLLIQVNHQGNTNFLLFVTLYTSCTSQHDHITLSFQLSTAQGDGTLAARSSTLHSFSTMKLEHSA